jgi:hypothetical protein
LLIVAVIVEFCAVLDATNASAEEVMDINAPEAVEAAAKEQAATATTRRGNLIGKIQRFR